MLELPMLPSLVRNLTELLLVVLLVPLKGIRLLLLKGGGSGLVCENSGFNGHTIERCFKIIGYPVGFGKKKQGQNFKGKNVSNNNYVGTSSSSGQHDWHCDLVHLDLWGPYKVTSSEGFKYFLTVMDDYTRAVWVYLIKSKDEDLSDFRGVSLKLWTECILTATYLINRLPSSVLNGKSPYEMIYKKHPSLSHLRVFGCLCFATIVNINDKFGSRFEKSVMIGIPYDDERVDPNLNSESKSQSDSSHSSVSGRDVNTADFLNNSGNDVDSSQDIFATQNEKVTTLEDNIFFEGNLDQNPRTSTQETPFSHWTNAMNSEMDALLKNDTWDIVDLPKDIKAIGSFGQKEGIDYEEIFSPVVKMFDKDVFLALLVYVDDIIINGNNVSEIDKFIRKYVLDLLSDYGMLACKPAKTPLMSKLVISNEASDNDHILDNITDYQKLMGN
ncbi:ribonuclease H-like domain-containing protein [Tanacetum coccineum]